MHDARNTGAQYLLEFMYKENRNSFVRSVSHFLESLRAHSGIRMSHFSHCHSVQSSSQHRTEYLLKKHAAAQRKFVSVCFLFLSFGEPLTDGLTQCFMYRSLQSLYCIAEPCHKRVSSDNVWLKITSTCFRS